MATLGRARQRWAWYGTAWIASLTEGMAMTRGTRAVAVIGLQFGDEGKGSVVDYLTSRHSVFGPHHFGTVVRFNGGAQAGHRVVRADSIPASHDGGGGGAHVFSQFSSGFFNGAMTHLSKFSLVDPLALVSEAEALDRVGVGQAFRRLTIDRHALLVTPFHSAANKAREKARGDKRHGSCGMGIGETTAFFLQHPEDAPRVGDAQDLKVLRRKLWGLHDFYAGLVDTADMPPIDALVSVYREFANWTKIVDEYYLPTILDHENVLFEGAQGVLLDQDYGFHPYTTWSRTTFANVVDLMSEAQDHDFERIGVVRTYATRHGAGPFPSEDPTWAERLPDAANVKGDWQGSFRVGPLDRVLLKYAVEAVGGVDSVVLNHVDRAHEVGRVCVGYEMADASLYAPITTGIMPPQEAGERGYQQRLGEMLMTAKPVIEDMSDVVAEVEESTGAPVVIVGRGPKAENKVVRTLLAKESHEKVLTHVA